MVFLLMVLFVSSGQPMLMVVSLMMVTLFYSMYVYFVAGGYWFSYALTLVVLSGVMVVFAYMASLSPNEPFEVFNIVLVSMFMFGVLGGKVFLPSEISEDMSFKLWEFCFGGFNLYLVSLLLVIMVVVVWLSNLGEGAVRIS